MHECPYCGQACYCHGDIEDHENSLEAEACEHECDDEELDESIAWDPEEL